MAAVHQNFVDLASRLIRANGRAIKIRRTTKIASQAQPWKKAPTPTTTDTATFGAFVDNDSDDLRIALTALARTERSQVQAEGTQVFIPAKGLSIEIGVNDRIVDGDTVWEIKAVNLIAPGPTKIMYVCDLGK